MQHSRLNTPLPDSLQNASEGEKADWYFEEEDEALARFEDAARSGTLEVTQPCQVQAKAATIYLPIGDMELAERQARALGLDTSTYLETVVRSAIHQKTAA